MTDEVQKIREEVERLINELIQERGKYYSSDVDDACILELQNVLTYIDSLPEDPKFRIGQYLKQGDTIVNILEVSDDGYHCDIAFIPFSAQDQWELVKDPVSEGRDIFDNCLKGEEKFILPQKISGNINCENCLYSSACALGDIQECIIDKPVNEELEEVSKNYALNNTPWDDCKDEIQESFKAGAEWQKQKDSIPVSKELGEYINELSKQFPEVSFAKLSRIAVRVAKWQEQKYEEALNIYLSSQSKTSNER